MQLKQLEELIQNLSTEEFDSLEEYRKTVIKLARQLSSKLKEGVEEVLDEESLKEYINLLMQECYLKLNKLPPVPIDLKVKERSKSYRTIFKQELENYSYTDSTKLIKISSDAIKSSACITDLRTALRLWKEIQLLYAERDRLEDEVLVLDAQVTFDTKNEELLEFYIQQNRELTEALTKDDEEYLLARKVYDLHKAGNGRVSISNSLGISEKKVRVLLDKYKFTDNSLAQTGPAFDSTE